MGSRTEAEDEEAAWEGWDVESDSDESESEQEDWIDVQSDGEDLVLSDSDDEGNKNITKAAEQGDKKEDLTTRVSTLATTKVHSHGDSIQIILLTETS